jgi:NADPH-ferrihemoprotein reductase
MATHGEGDPTDNAKPFIKWLTDRDEHHENLEGFKFAVFGLGNTQYEHYNKVGRFTNKSLEEYGGIRVFKYGEGDDNQSLEEDFNEWKSSLWVTLKDVLKDDIVEFQKRKEGKPETVTSVQLVYKYSTFLSLISRLHTR